MSLRNLFVLCALGAGALGASAFAGCGHSPLPPQADVAETGHKHDGWWCDEHGVPEEVCARCDTKLVADFKAKGDWCNEHDRPDSQCFVCHPEKEAEFAAQYEAKYGKQPPKPEAEAHENEPPAKS
jgi:cobalt-zinc-cadmium efflux system membrane fusion protein